MNDFLSHLMARSFADAPAIQPRVPSRFEAGVAEPLADAQFFPEPPTETRASDSVDAVAPAPTQNISVSSGQNAEAKNTPATISESAQPPSFSEMNSIQPAIGQVPPVRSAKQFPSSAIRPVPPSPEANHFSEANRMVRRRTSSAQFEQPSTTGVPTINITIGRVEVRAIHSSAPAPNPAKPAPPRLSLDDYLQKREGGAR